MSKQPETNLWPVVVVTGMSGAGRTTALKSLEGIGFEVVDNLPIALVRFFIREEREKEASAEQISLLRMMAGSDDSEKKKKEPRPLAIGIDIRTRDFGVEPVKSLMRLLQETPDIDAKLLFIDCDDNVLQRRFTETRMLHPLARDRRLEDGITMERKLIEPLKELADVIMDTTDMTINDIKIMVERNLTRREKREVSISITSFSYRNGLPRSADLVFDVRFLKNPHYVEKLKHLTGLDQKVGEYIASDPIYATFIANLVALTLPLLPRYAAEGKSYLTIAFGCTGGKHRSVHISEKFASLLADRGIIASVYHRELENNPKAG